MSVNNDDLRVQLLEPPDHDTGHEHVAVDNDADRLSRLNRLGSREAIRGGTNSGDKEASDVAGDGEYERYKTSITILACVTLVGELSRRLTCSQHHNRRCHHHHYFTTLPPITTATVDALEVRSRVNR